MYFHVFPGIFMYFQVFSCHSSLSHTLKSRAPTDYTEMTQEMCLRHRREYRVDYTLAFALRRIWFGAVEAVEAAHKSWMAWKWFQVKAYKGFQDLNMSTCVNIDDTWRIFEGTHTLIPRSVRCWPDLNSHCDLSRWSQRLIWSNQKKMLSSPAMFYGTMGCRDTLKIDCSGV